MKFKVVLQGGKEVEINAAFVAVSEGVLTLYRWQLHPDTLKSQPLGISAFSPSAWAACLLSEVSLDTDDNVTVT